MSKMPRGRKATYIIHIMCADGPKKTEPRGVCFMVGTGDQVDYPGIVSTKTADLTTAKILIKSVLSTPNAKYMTGDLKDFYLNTPMEHYDYVRIPVNVIPNSIMVKYNLLDSVNPHRICISEICKGMYGLSLASRIANNRLTTFLAPHGYALVLSPLAFGHTKMSNLAFTLVVD
jgi:hypothetical protein